MVDIQESTGDEIRKPTISTRSFLKAGILGIVGSMVAGAGIEGLVASIITGNHDKEFLHKARSLFNSLPAKLKVTDESNHTFQYYGEKANSLTNDYPKLDEALYFHYEGLAQDNSHYAKFYQEALAVRSIQSREKLASELGKILTLTDGSPDKESADSIIKKLEEFAECKGDLAKAFRAGMNGGASNYNFGEALRNAVVTQITVQGEFGRE